MDINGYKHNLEQFLSQQIGVEAIEIQKLEIVPNYGTKFKASILLRGGYSLHIYENMAAGNCSRREALSYGYQLRSPDGIDVLRWDNSPHYPFEHLHIGDQLPPKRYEKPSLRKLFEEARKWIANKDLKLDGNKVM